MKKALLIMFIFQLPLSALLFADPICSKYTLPSIHKGCQGESCGSIEYDKAIKNENIYANPSSTSTVVDRLKRCDVIKNFQPIVVIHSFGKGKVISVSSDMPKELKVGDIIPITQYHGEGYYDACVEQTEFVVRVTGEPIDDVILLSDPDVEDWIQITSPRGHQGYIPATENFYIDHDTNPSITQEIKNKCR